MRWKTTKHQTLKELEDLRRTQDRELTVRAPLKTNSANLIDNDFSDTSAVAAATTAMTSIIAQEKVNEPKLEDKFIEELVMEMKVSQNSASITPRNRPQMID